MQYEETYTENDGKCSVGDTSCNWVGKTKIITHPDPLDDGLEQEECNINCDLGIQQQTTGEDLGWVNSILAYEWTPLIMDLIQFGTTIGIIFILGATVITPGLALLAIGLGFVSVAAMVIGMASLGYQAGHELNGVTYGDFLLSVGLNLVAPLGGVIPEVTLRSTPRLGEFVGDTVVPAINVLWDIFSGSNDD